MTTEEFSEEGRPGSRSCNWFLTINNPETTELAQHASEKYAVWQLEKGESGTPHLQATLVFPNALHFNAVKKVYPRARIEKVRYLHKAIKYCKKEDTRLEGPWERGEAPKGQGKRTDLDAACDMLKQGASMRDVCMEHASVVAKFGRHLQYVQALLQESPRDSDFDPRAWQQIILDKLKEPADDRKIIWVYDNKGNAGKSRLARHLLAEYNAISLSGKVADMVYAYNNEPIVIFDVSRTQADNMQHLYDMAERLKNGALFNTKYESRMKLFKPPHVIFFSNSLPDMRSWSEDRYDIMDLVDYNTSKRHRDY